MDNNQKQLMILLLFVTLVPYLMQFLSENALSSLKIYHLLKMLFSFF